MEEKKDIKAVTVEDVKAELEKTLKRMADAREGKLKDGERFRRTPYDSLSEKGLLTPDALVREYDIIADKKSVLSANERDFVWDICTDAMLSACAALTGKHDKAGEPAEIEPIDSSDL